MMTAFECLDPATPEPHPPQDISVRESMNPRSNEASLSWVICIPECLDEHTS